MSDEWNLGLIFTIFLVIVTVWLISVLVIEFKDVKRFNSLTNPGYSIDIRDTELIKRSNVIINKPLDR